MGQREYYASGKELTNSKNYPYCLQWREGANYEE